MKSTITAFLLLSILTATRLQAQWQGYDPAFADTVGAYDLRISSSNPQTAWSLMTKYFIDEDGFYNWLPMENLRFAKTSNGGLTWSEGAVVSAEELYPSSITCVDENTAWVAAIDSNFVSHIIKTKDGGATWTAQLENGFSSPSSYANYIHFWDAQNGIVIGDPASSDTNPDKFWEVYKTSDGGQNWTRVSSDQIPAPEENEVGYGGDFFVTGDHIWFPAFDYSTYSWTRIFKSDDRGANWTAVTAYCGVLSFADSLHGIGRAYNNGAFPMRYTADGGNTWSNLPELKVNNLASLALIPESYFLLAVVIDDPFVDEARTILSTDLGASWMELGTSQGVPGNAKFASPTLGYAGGWQPNAMTTRMYKYNGNPLVGLFSGVALNADVTLAPNPVSEHLQVRVQVAEPASFTLLLNDAQGKLMERKTLEPSADIQTDFDVHRLPAGVYTLTVSSEKGFLTRKIVKQ